ncbi:hypothetical protein AB0903_17270 [Streptomyces sp. NPDC048389]|uniref:hypothetical protein n=1 Tax=Streptomyces sp. NPDC048389 TaxID=3154622 RepID=UPI0034572A84
MPVLRQITTCPEPATYVVEARSRKAGRALEFRVEVCGRHRWLVNHWTGRRQGLDPGGRCGTMLDHRPYERVVASHADEWMVPLTAQHPDHHGGSVAGALRAAHEWMTDAGGPAARGRRDGALLVALGHAARIAEAIEAGDVDAEGGRAQLLAALSVVETVAVAERGA